MPMTLRHVGGGGGGPLRTECGKPTLATSALCADDDVHRLSENFLVVIGDSRFEARDV